MAQEENGMSSKLPSVAMLSMTDATNNIGSSEKLNSAPQKNGVRQEESFLGKVGPSSKNNEEKSESNGTALESTEYTSPSSNLVSELTKELQDCPGRHEPINNSESPPDNSGQSSISAVSSEQEEILSPKSVDAISLADIRATIVNDEIGETRKVSVDASKPLDECIIIPQTQSGSSQETVLPVSPAVSVPADRSDKSSDIIVKEPNSHTKIISAYAIQPGELTDLLIEGPSITLPSSELSNRISSISTNTDHALSGGKQSRSDISSLNPSIVNSESSCSKATSVSESCSTATSVSGSCTTSSTLSESCSGSLKTESSTSDQSFSTSPPPTQSPTPAPAKRVKKTPHDFIFGKVLGEGSYSTVYLAKEVSSQREFAVKVCEKKHLIREHKTHFVMREKEVLMKLDHPFFIKLAYTFQDQERLYYVLTYARNGELLSYLNKLSVFDVPCTRFYSAEVVVALEYLHGLGIIHRDLKPENILLGEDMHIKITDFGTSKILNGAPSEEETKRRQSRRKNSFVGTAEYVTPEVLNGLPVNYGTDLWALACIIYQCLSSSLPFRGGNEYQTFQKILKLDYDFPPGFHEEAKDLVQKVLLIEPTERLGMKQPGGMQALKEHPFFQSIDWEGLPHTTPPELLPYLPASANNPEFWGAQEQRTGFDDQRLAEIITGQSAERCQSPELEPISVLGKGDLGENEWSEKMERQRQENQFHPFVENNLILRQGFVDKRKGLFARKRMLLLTEGPHLYYVDAHNKVLKGEIPWSKELRPEAKNFKIFFVHTPNRTYYLESRNPDAHHWVKHIQEVWHKYYDNGKS